MVFVFSLVAYSNTFLVYSFSPMDASSSFTFATYIKGFCVIKLNGFKINFSSSVNSINRIGIFFSNASLHFFNTSNSASASFSLVVSAFLAIFSIRLSMISKSANISSILMISISRIGFTPPSTWVMLLSSKHLTTSTMASTSRIWDKNLFPNPSPLEAPFTSPAISVNSKVVGTKLFGIYRFSKNSKRESGTVTTPTLGSMVANG